MRTPQSTDIEVKKSPAPATTSVILILFHTVAAPKMMLRRSQHRRPKSLRTHALHNPVLVKADDKGICGQVIIDCLINLQPVVVVLRPWISCERLAVGIDQHVEVILIVCETISLRAQICWKEAEVGVGRQIFLGQEIRAVADPLFNLDTWAAVDSQRDG